MKPKSLEIRLRVTIDDDVTDPNYWPWEHMLGPSAVLTDIDIIGVPLDQSGVGALRKKDIEYEKQKRNKA